MINEPEVKLFSACSDENVFRSIVAKAKNVPEGCFVEIGVYKGGSAAWLTHLAEQQNRQVYLYDTFEGMPYSDDIDHHLVGDFADTDYETVKNALPYATVIKGIFPDSAIEMGPIAFAHIDVDQYKAHVDCLNYILPNMVPGGIVWFDDYGGLDGARKAVDEFFPDGVQLADCGHGKAFVIV